MTFPRTITEALTAIHPGCELRAGGTDFQERCALGLAGRPIVDLRDLAELERIEWSEAGVRIGARVTIAAVANDPDIRRHYPGFAQAADALATPQIRAVATVGGNLLQRSRCWYYRHPRIRCFKSGADGCPARTGNHLYGVCFDLGPCVAPHPSTLGMTLLAYDAQLIVAGGPDRNIGDLYGDGQDPRFDHRLGGHEIVTAVALPPPVAGERASYVRATGRALADWPLVEVSARLVLEGGTVTLACLAMGGVANIPLRLPRVEARLRGSNATPRVLADAAQLAAEGARPLTRTEYKVTLIPTVVHDALNLALAGM